MARLPDDQRSGPTVSLVIPTHDRLGLLQETVASVMRQTLTDWEAIVVDDASSDGTAGWLTEQEDDRLTAVILEEHAGMTRAKNIGLERARADLVLFLDDDDLLAPSALKRLHHALVSDVEAIGSVGAVVLFDERGNHRKLRWPRRTLKRVVWTDVLAWWDIYVQAALWRTDAMRAVGGWNESITFSTGLELMRRVSRLGPMILIPEVVVAYRMHGGQLTGTIPTEIRRTSEDVWLQEHIRSLPPEERVLAERVADAYRVWRSGRDAYANLECREGLTLYLRALRAAPFLLRSPLLRPVAIGSIAKASMGALIGKRGLSAVRDAKTSLKKSLKRSVGR